MDNTIEINMKRDTRVAHWIAPDTTNLPDFIIGGAMKSGTTTLHTILNRHSRVYIPPGEIHFFDIDNIFQHSDFNFYDKVNDRWLSQSMEDNPDKMWEWYLSKFVGKEGFVKGEDSTTYLASKIAVERIAIQPKEIKLIFVLRHPTERAYSQYHHMLRTGRAVYTFEDTIRFDPASILERSLYKEQLENYYRLIPKNRIKIILFEDLVTNTEDTLKSICDYLKISSDEFNKDVLSTHSNKARVPKNIEMQAVRNRLLRSLGNMHYTSTLPYTTKHVNTNSSKVSKIIDRAHNYLNPKLRTKPPKMKESTRKFLDQLFIRELSGIDEVVEQNILDRWFESN